MTSTATPVAALSETGALPGGVDLAVCGEMAGRPVEALALLAVGTQEYVK